MFTRNKIRLPELTGDWKRDGPEFKRALALYYESLEAPDALAIVEYEPWTPVLTFGTPGDLAVTYSIQVGRYQKCGRLIVAQVRLTTSAFTHTTAAGNLLITGMSFTALNVTNHNNVGGCFVGGVTKANYTNFALTMQANSSSMRMVASGSGQAISNVAAADMPTGGTVVIGGTVVYVAE